MPSESYLSKMSAISHCMIESMNKFVRRVNKSRARFEKTMAITVERNAAEHAAFIKHWKQKVARDRRAARRNALRAAVINVPVSVPVSVPVPVSVSVPVSVPVDDRKL